MTSLFHGPVIHRSQNAGVGSGRAPSPGFQTQLMLECSDQEAEIPLICNFQVFDCSKDGRNLITQSLEVFCVCEGSRVSVFAFLLWGGKEGLSDRKPRLSV